MKPLNKSKKSTTVVKKPKTRKLPSPWLEFSIGASRQKKETTTVKKLPPVVKKIYANLKPLLPVATKITAKTTTASMPPSPIKEIKSSANISNHKHATDLIAIKRKNDSATINETTTTIKRTCKELSAEQIVCTTKQTAVHTKGSVTKFPFLTMNKFSVPPPSAPTSSAISAPYGKFASNNNNINASVIRPMQNSDTKKTTLSMETVMQVAESIDYAAETNINHRYTIALLCNISTLQNQQQQQQQQLQQQQQQLQLQKQQQQQQQQLFYQHQPYSNPFKPQSECNQSRSNHFAHSIPAWNFTTAEEIFEDDFPHSLNQFDDEHYLYLEKLACLGLKLALGNPSPHQHNFRI